VLGQWGGAELETFESVVAPWQNETGGDMKFTGTRDITSLLTLNVEGGSPPDIAIPAEIGLLQKFARAGELVPLSACGLEEEVRANFPQAFLDLGTVDGVLYGFFFKADGKATIWYNPGFFTDQGYEPLTADATFDDLLAFSQEIEDDGVVAPWSIGVESGGASGWPGTDWLQAILMNNVDGGLAANDGLIDGSVAWTDPAVKDAWEKFGAIALEDGWVSQGGGDGIVATNFVDAIYPPFDDPPAAALHHQAGFAALEIVNQFPAAAAGTDFDFFPWPGGAVIGSADVVYAFNDDEATCSMMKYLASAAAQQIWVEAGGAISPNTGVDASAYPDAVIANAAERLTQAETFRFDLDDTLGGATQQAIWAGILEYLTSPGDLDTILSGIEDAAVAQRAAAAEES
jgi:alpha-glucoside transport system substrate-binding protein